MEYRDYYATLGVAKKASKADVKKAFRKLAREHHPDVNKDDAAAEERFKEISEAYDVLSDPEKRKAYDQLGANWAAYQNAGPGAAPGRPFAGFAGAAGGAGGGAPGGARFEYRGTPQDLSGFSDFFRAFFSGATGATAAGGAGAGGDIDLDPLFGGIGGDSGAGHAASGFGTASARGTRRAAYQKPSDASADATLSLEEVMRGTERHLDVAGKRLELKIPPGVKDGQRIRLSGKAASGGDIYVTVHVKAHPRFLRDGADLSMELPLSLGEALLGTEVTIDTLSGKKLLLTIPAATQNGRVFRLAGQGLPRFGKDSSGDLRVRTSIVMPAALDDEAAVKAHELIDLIQQPDPRQAAPAGTPQQTERTP
ncbi:MAG: DnaJ C-terminal domain-containing protein [Chloroflexota bacterium]